MLLASGWRHGDLYQEGAGEATNPDLCHGAPGRERWVSLWLQNMGLSAGACILAQNEPDSKPQQGLGIAVSFCQTGAEVRTGGPFWDHT